MAADYYALLGVAPSASQEDIKRAYRKLARELHPDTNPDPTAHERFREITVAYETLRDAERRRRYDAFGPEGAAAGAGAAGFSDLGDVFEAFFGSGSPFGGGRRRGRGGPPRGADLETRVELDFEEAVFGVSTDITLRLPVLCETCGGSGAKPPTQPVPCRRCDATGQVQQVRQSLLGQMVTAGPCPDCGGLGQVVVSPCEVCRGEGRRHDERTYNVDVPPGVDDGATLRLSGRGAAGPRGGPPGDLYVHVQVRPHDRFQRAGHDLVHELHIPVTQAALGTHLPFATLDGEEDLVVPPGTQTGRTFRLRNRGVPHVGGRGRGDLLVRVVVDTPTSLSREQEDLLRQLAAQRGEDVAETTGLLSRIRSAFS